MEQPNLSYIKRLSKGKKAFEENIINIVKEELTEEIKNYFKFISESNFKKTRESVHRIKHKMSILGLEKSYEITNTFENNLREGSIENRDYFENILPVMTTFLEKL